MPPQAGLLLQPKARFTVGRKTGQTAKAATPPKAEDAEAEAVAEKAQQQQQQQLEEEQRQHEGGGDEQLQDTIPAQRPVSSGGKAQGGGLEPLSYLEPKVMVPFNVPPGTLPRRVEIDRKKRLFAAQDVQTLLTDEGVDPTEASVFDLAVFDNTDAEQRTAPEWVPKAIPEGGVEAPAKVMFRDFSGNVTWTDCTVVDFDESDNSYKCQPVDGSDPRWMHRIFVHFTAEDPFVYTQRVAEAIRERRAAESKLRYDFFIDSMPTEDIPPLMTEQVNRMLGYALNSKKLKDKLMDTSQLVNEINIEYARTMNKVVFETSLSQSAAKSTHDLMAPMSETFPKPPPKEVRCGAVPCHTSLIRQGGALSLRVHSHTNPGPFPSPGFVRPLFLSLPIPIPHSTAQPSHHRHLQHTPSIRNPRLRQTTRAAADGKD